MEKWKLLNKNKTKPNKKHEDHLWDTPCLQPKDKRKEKTKSMQIDLTICWLIN